MRKRESHPKRVRRGEDDAVFHREIGYAALARQNRPIRNESRKIQAGKFLPDESLILGKLKGLRQLFLVARPIETGVLHTGRKEVKEDLLKLCSVNGSPVGRKTYMETENQYSVAWCADLAGCPGEDFLTAAAYGKETALSGTFRLETELVDLGGKAPQ